MAHRRAHHPWKRIGSGTKGGKKPKAKTGRVKPPIDRDKMRAAMAEIDAEFLAREAVRKPDSALPPPTRVKGATPPRGSRRTLVTGYCHGVDCDRPVSGERLFCGPCLASRI